MKKSVSLRSGASALALMIGSGIATAADLPAPVEPVVEKGRILSGTVGLFGSYSSLDGDSNDIEEHAWGIGGEALVDIPLSDRVSLQLDQYGEFMFSGHMTTSEDYTGGYLTGAHLNTREMNRYLFGIMGGVGGFHYASTTDDAYLQWLIGLEGQYYLGNTTLYGQVGYSDVKSNDSTSQNSLAEAWFLRGVVRHYFNAGDTKLEGELGFARGVNDNTRNNTTDDVDAWSWGGEIEHAFRSYADDGFISGYARYEGYHYDEDISGGGSDSGSAHIFMIGMKMDFNQSNPLERERYGVAVDLHNANRLNGHARLVE